MNAFSTYPPFGSVALTVTIRVALASWSRIAPVVRLFPLIAKRPPAPSVREKVGLSMFVTAKAPTTVPIDKFSATEAFAKLSSEAGPEKSTAGASEVDSTVPLALDDLRPNQCKVPKFPTVPSSLTELPADDRRYSTSIRTPVPLDSRRAASATGGQANQATRIVASVRRLCRERFI